MEAIANKDPLLKKAVVRLMELSADEKTRLLYEAREKERMDRESREEWVRDTGRAEGRVEERFEIAENMVTDGESVEKIMRYTGLTRAEVEGLRNAD